MRKPHRKEISAAAACSLAIAGLAGLSGCGGNGGAQHRRNPAGISIDFSEAASPVPAELLPRLNAIGVRSIFAPAVEFSADGGVPRFEPAAPPDSKYPLPVYLVVRGTGDLDEYLKSAAGRAGEEIWRALRPALTSGRYGDIAGVHLDLRVANSAGEYASALGSIRSRIPKAMTLSAAVETKLSEDQLKKWRSVGRQVDFLVPVVYGRGGRAGAEGARVSGSTAQAFEVGRAVFPEYCPQGWGLFRASGGEARAVSDASINDLSEDRRFDFEFGSLLSDADENVYVFRARQPGSRAPWGEGGFEPGDTVTFWENRPSDFTQGLSDPLAARGKILRLRSLDDQDHLIGFSAIEDILLGRKLEPKLAFSRSAGDGEVTFLVVNSSPEYSELSRLNNWVDLRMDGGRLLDIRPGDFDRFEFLDAAGKQSVAGRARTIRFYENFVAPGESMTGGPIRYSGEAAFFASAHLTLPDGRVVTVGELPV
ncbi:MAG TPA: hypothetical protein VFS34_16670, partial [Thermoanaerobaculia bacterium]|nr:hypothetical protein [Thermoanaerobaculia bacterium]